MPDQAQNQKITPFLWFDSNAVEAAALYTSLFKNSFVEGITRYSESGANAAGRTKGSVMTIMFRLDGFEFTALNGGPVIEMTPAISFFVNCTSAEETDHLWTELEKEGTIFMPMDKYPFSEKFGWLKDRFGVSWQLNMSNGGQKITPYLLFTGPHLAEAEEAMNFYISLFENSGVLHLEHFGQGEPGGEAGSVKHGRFSLNGQEFIVMDSNLDHQFTFTPALSFVVNCDSQDEIDKYWEKLSEGGDETAQQCGWLQDKFGVSWQIVPSVWADMIFRADSQTAERLMQAVLRMKKIDLALLKRIEAGGGG